MEDWKRLELKGCFSIDIPGDAKPRVDDDGTTAVIRLGSGADVTEVLLSNYPLRKVTPDQGDQAEVLRELLAEFFTSSVQEAFGHSVPFNVEPVEDPGLGDVSCAQGVAVFERDGDAIWVARVYARPGQRRFWIMHWNGPKDNLEAVMRSFVSFEPESSSFR